MNKIKRKTSPWFIWWLVTLFFCYEFLVRVAPSSMVQDLMSAFAVSASSIGFINACYLYIFSPMQIPIGVLMDRYGVRILVCISCITITLGCFLFSLASGMVLASLGRFFMGLGSAVGFVAVVFGSSHWFPANRLSYLVGIANSIGMLGAFLGQGPISILHHYFGWRYVFFVLTGIGSILGFFLLLYLYDNTDLHRDLEYEPVGFFDHLCAVCGKSTSWWNACACFLYYSLTSVFAGLWGISFLVNVHNIRNETASFAISFVFLGWILGGPIIGKLADYCQKERLFLTTGPLCALMCILPVLYVPGLSVQALYGCLLFTGIFSAAQILHFTVSIEINPKESKATAIAFTNFVTMLGASFMQPLVGFLLDFYGPNLIEDNIRIYSKEAWMFATSVFPIALILASLMSLSISQKKHQTPPEVSF